MGKITGFTYQRSPIKYTVTTVGTFDREMLNMMIEHNLIAELKYTLSFGGDIAIIDKKRKVRILYQGAFHYTVDVNEAKPFGKERMSDEMIESMLPVAKHFMKIIYDMTNGLKQKESSVANTEYLEFGDNELKAFLRSMTIRQNPNLN